VKKVGSKESFEAARACNSCYEAVFPVVDSDDTDEDITPEHRAHYSSIGTLTALPFSKSTPSLALLTNQESSVYPTPMKYELPVPVKIDNGQENERPKSGLDFLPMSRPKLPGSRPPSEFMASSYSPSVIEPQSPVFKQLNASSATMSTFDSPISPTARVSFDIKPRPRPSATFSTPAVALHTTPVTAKVSISADSRSSRNSLVFTNKSRPEGGSSGTGSKDSEIVRGRRSLDAGLAMHKLTDLLGRK
jgi:FYVE/RhoGEF/PH domain-containing protein 5/6